MNFSSSEKKLILIGIVLSGLMSILGNVVIPYSITEESVFFNVYQYIILDPNLNMALCFVVTLTTILAAVSITIFIIYFKRFTNKFSGSIEYVEK